jgi:integrase
MPIYKTGKSKDGKQGYRVRVNYTDGNGKYQTKTQIVYGAPEAKAAEQALLASVAEQPMRSRMTVKNLFDEYIAVKRLEVRDTTLDKAASILSNNVLPYLGNVKISKLDLCQLQGWKTTISEKDLAIITMQNIYSAFRAMLNYAVRMEYIPKNPLDRIGNFKEVYFENPQDTIRYYTADQFKKFIAVAAKHMDTMTDRGYYVFFNIAFFTGLRKGEINALRWGDIDGNILHVRRSVAQKIKGKPIIETPPKNKSSYRDLQLPQNLMVILQEHKALQQKEKSFTEEYRVCGGISCLGDTSISNRNIRYADEAGLPHIRIHDFRHSHASLLANEGINIQEIARRLGHSKIEITWNTYSHLYPREEERAIKILESL